MFLKKIIRGFYFLVILFLVVLTLKPVFASSTTSNWWDSSYGFRKKLSLTASKSNLAEGYQAEFTIDTKALFDAGSLRADGRDLKLVYHDGATATELNYSVETPQTLLLNTIDNSGTTILVDDVNNFPATGKIIINNEVISYTSLDTKAIASPAAVLPGAGGATANINDGSLTTLSDTYPGDASGYDWYSLTWSEARTFNRVRFKEKAYFDGWIVSYNIQYWNGSDWVNVANSSASKTLPANGTDGTVVNVRFDEVSTTKLRIYALTGGAATFIGLYEFEAYYSPAVTNQAKTTNSLGGIARAQNSTTAASHNAGTKVKLAPSSFTTTKLKFKVKKTIQPEETDDNYYLYYGKSDQSTASGTSVFLTEDDFTSDTLNSAWTWTTPIAGPTKSVVQSTNSGYFNAVLPSTGTFDFWYWTDEAPTFLRSPPLGDWSIETKVSLEDDETCCSHAGIMVKFNAWVAYMWGFYYGGSPVARSLEFDKTGTVLTNVSGYTAKQVYLRVRKVARTYYFDYKQNYTDAWTNAGSDSSVAFGVPISLGFYEKSWSDKPYTSTFFDDYKLTKYVYPNDSTIYSVSLDTERPYNTTASTVSAANSKIEVSPSTVVLGADYSSAFTVTVVDTYGDPISGKIVSVSSSRSGDVVSLDSTSSDSNGQITGSVMSAASGTSVLTATAGSTTITGTASVTFTTKEPYDFTAFGKLLRLPYFHSDSTVEEWTSHDQTGGNTDTGGYLSRDGTEYVIADEKGSGVVSHIWLVASDADLTSMGNLKIYVDGSATPSLNYSIANFFGGANSPLFIPLVDNNIGSSGGFYSYLQIPYTMYRTPR